MSETTPNPGSSEAISMGCTCPVLDNAHGKGYMGQPGIFVYVEGCPVHESDPAKQLALLARQTKTDLAAAHAEICKLQGIDPATHSWPEWSSPAHTIAWCDQILASALPTPSPQ